MSTPHELNSFFAADRELEIDVMAARALAAIMAEHGLSFSYDIHHGIAVNRRSRKNDKALRPVMWFEKAFAADDVKKVVEEMEDL